VTTEELTGEGLAALFVGWFAHAARSGSVTAIVVTGLVSFTGVRR
jgi:hypothetical protein